MKPFFLLNSNRWFTLCWAVILLINTLTGALHAAEQRLPNIVIIYADDMGYADLGSYGARGYKTPHLDRMASEGTRFTSFYVAQAVCSASRAALLTGCYPNRIGILGALGPSSKVALSSNEMTIAEMLKPKGYATALYGKWHLGHRPGNLPKDHGFDDYFGLPYSNDMWPNHPEAKPGTYPDLPLIDGDKVVQLNPDQAQLTTWYTDHAVHFIERNKDRPFFLYLAHNMPHVPLYASEKTKGKTAEGLYGDVIAELDWSVGRVLETLKHLNLDDNTLVVFASDNGPWLLYGNHAGSPGPLREGKATTFEGGMRVPCIMRWPGKIPAGRVRKELASTIDILPTIASLTGASLPKDRIIDGRNLWPLVAGQRGAASPHETFFYYWGDGLEAVRSGPWKLHFPHSYPKPDPAGANGKPGKYSTQKIGLALFNLDQDLGETTDVAAQHPEIVERLQRLADLTREDLGDSSTKQKGKNVRAPARIE